MPKLNDTQSVLLASAAKRDSGSVFPLPAAVTPGARVANAIVKLTSAALIQERETSDPAAVHREDGDLRFGLFITPAGLAAIGIEPEGGEESGNTTSSHDQEQAPSPAPAATPGVAAAAAPRDTKTARVLALLSRPDGATLSELIEATGWLPHTTRAALTGLRKKGHKVERGKRGDATCYRVVAGEASA